MPGQKKLGNVFTRMPMKWRVLLGGQILITSVLMKSRYDTIQQHNQFVVEGNQRADELFGEYVDREDRGKDNQ